MSNINIVSGIKARISTKPMTSLLIAAPFIVALTVSSAYAKGQEGDSSHRPMQAMLKGLDLTDTQKEQLQELRKQARENRVLYRGERKEGQSLRQQADNLDIWDEAQMRSLIASKVANRQANKLAQAEIKHAMYAVLTKAQQAQLAEKRAAHKAGKASEARAAKQHKRLLKMAQRVGATESQISELKVLHTQHVSVMNSLKITAQDHKRAEQAIIHADEFDVAQWHELQAAFTDSAIELGLQKAQYQHAVKQVFNDEQQAQLKAMKKRAQKKMKRKMKQKKS